MQYLIDKLIKAINKLPDEIKTSTKAMSIPPKIAGYVQTTRTINKNNDGSFPEIKQVPSTIFSDDELKFIELNLTK